LLRRRYGIITPSLTACDDIALSIFKPKARLYVQTLGYFNSLKALAMFTPDDNDWTDCTCLRLFRGTGLPFQRSNWM
jgi:hypothetical protein